ncbi:copine-9-like [Babylonia areolata]|uniref:copine-9-like n=1 Tax=Babylonia areolata TaxID=304850 RepID=UPI003FD5B91D
MNGSAIGQRRSRGTVELLVRCRDLADLDVFTKTDPVCVLFVRQFGQWKEFARTEAIRSTLNPKFVESFVLEYDDTVQQQLLFSVYDIDSRSTDLRQHDFVGSVEVMLSDLMDPSSPLLTSTRTLRVPGDPKPRGTLHVTSEIVRRTRSKVQVHVVGHKLDKVGFLQRKPDVFLEVGRAVDSITFHPVFRTEVQSKTRHPWWRPFDLTVQRLCNDDWDRPVQFSCWHVNFSGGPGSTFHMTGKVTTTLREMNRLKNDGHYKKLHLLSPKKEKSKKKEAVAGTLRFYQFRVDMQYSLLDYIRGGMELRLVVAIDFTASNGAITESLSLHNMQAKRNNQYLNALEAVGGVLCRYDLQQRVAVFGFGAKLSPGDPTPSHCFPLHQDVWVTGIKGVEEAYHSILPSLTFAGPTYVSPVLRRTVELVQPEDGPDSRQYFVLLVITDGIINDIDKTVELLVEASSLPLSVIVTGVGPTNFVLMEQFTQSLHGPLYDEHSKKRAVRPNAHFAALKQDAMTTGGGLQVVQETLAALSSQVLHLMKLRDLSPGRARLARADPAAAWVTPHDSTPSSHDPGEGDSGELWSLGHFQPLPTTTSSFKASVRSARVSPAPFLHRAVSTPALLPPTSSVLSLNGPVCPTCGSTITLDTAAT